jgi:hypothetical protein
VFVSVSDLAEAFRTDPVQDPAVWLIDLKQADDDFGDDQAGLRRSAQLPAYDALRDGAGRGTWLLGDPAATRPAVLAVVDADSPPRACCSDVPSTASKPTTPNGCAPGASGSRCRWPPSARRQAPRPIYDADVRDDSRLAVAPELEDVAAGLWIATPLLHGGVRATRV